MVDQTLDILKPFQLHLGVFYIDVQETVPLMPTVMKVYFAIKSRAMFHFVKGNHLKILGIVTTQEPIRPEDNKFYPLIYIRLITHICIH